MNEDFRKAINEDIKRAMKEEVKRAILSMLKSGELKIELDTRSDWYSKTAHVVVKIDDAVICECSGVTLKNYDTER